MSLGAEIEHVVRRLDQRLACCLIATEAMMQLLDMHHHQPVAPEQAGPLHDYLARQFERYQARQMTREHLLANLEAARDLHLVMD